MSCRNFSLEVWGGELKAQRAIQVIYVFRMYRAVDSAGKRSGKRVLDVARMSCLLLLNPKNPYPVPIPRIRFFGIPRVGFKV